MRPAGLNRSGTRMVHKHDRRMQSALGGVTQSRARHDPSGILTRRSTRVANVYCHFSLFTRLCFLRTGPQDVPDSPVLMWSMLVLHWLLGLVLVLFSHGIGQAAATALVGTLLVVALVHGALTFTGRPHRFSQTVTAMAGAEFMLGLLALAITLWYYSGGSEWVASALSLLLLGWNVAVAAHIFRHALDGTPLLGVASALAYTMISYFVSGLLTGAGG